MLVELVKNVEKNIKTEKIIYVKNVEIMKKIMMILKYVDLMIVKI